MTSKDALLKAVVEPNSRADLRGMPLDAKEGFVLSRIDGTCSVKTLSMLVGMNEDEACRIVDKLLTLGAVGFKVSAKKPVVTQAPPAPVVAKAPEPPKKKERPKEDVDLPEADQQKIFDLHSALSSLTHYDVLQIPRDTPASDLKSAYYRFSKDYHPDRFFGRKLGSYKPMLEQLFKAGKTAYEVLSDAETRRAYDQKIPAPAPGLEIDNEFAKRAALEAHRQRIMDERKSKHKNPFQEQVDKAKAYATESEELFRKGDVVNAAAKLALALAYDPLNEQYQRRHSELLPLATEARTKALSAQANKDAERGDFASAARAYREAYDVSANATFAARAAEYFYRQGAELDLARSLIEEAIAKSQRNGDYRLTHALILEKQAQTALAREALKAALDLGCEDAEAKKLSKRLR